MLYISCLVQIDGKRGFSKRPGLAYSSEGIKRDLLEGTTIVVDRYVYSGVAFTAAKVAWTVTVAYSRG